MTRDRSHNGLSSAGEIWLKPSTSLSISELGSAQLLVQSISRTFGISTRESVVAVCAVLSVVIGQSHRVRDYTGETIPMSMQLLVACGGRVNLYRAVNALGQSVVDMFARSIGRRRVIESPPQDAVAKLRQEKKSQIFPLGDVLDPELARKLVESDGDSSFGSLSHTMALKEFMATPPKDTRFLDTFMRAGWNGNMIPAVEGHPVYPTVSLLWGAENFDVQEAIRGGVLTRLPGLLVARPVFDEGDTFVPKPWPDALRQQWIKMILNQFVTRLRSLPPHIDPESALVITFEDEAESEIAIVDSLHARYTQGHGVASELLQNAHLHVAKIAGLLAVIKSLPHIDKSTVKSALEIYRGLFRDTLAVVREAMEGATDSPSLRRQKIRDKLSVLGPLSLRDLAGAYPKMEVEGLLPLVSEMIKEGAVLETDGKFQINLMALS